MSNSTNTMAPAPAPAAQAPAVHDLLLQEIVVCLCDFTVAPDLSRSEDECLAFVGASQANGLFGSAFHCFLAALNHIVDCPEKSCVGTTECKCAFAVCLSESLFHIGVMQEVHSQLQQTGTGDSGYMTAIVTVAVCVTDSLVVERCQPHTPGFNTDLCFRAK